MTAPKPKDTKGITTSWAGAKEMPIAVSDFLHWRVADDRCYLTFGQLNLPPIEGAIPDGSDVEIRTVSRLVVSASTLRVWLPLLAAAEAALPKVEEGKK